jgi:hypothetical protein
MVAFVFNCPETGLKVQHWFDDDGDKPDNEYELVWCQACTRLHLINRKTGKPLGHEEEGPFSVLPRR